MAIKLFATEAPSGEGQKPFLNNLLAEELLDLTEAKVRKKWLGQPFLVHRIALAKSGKGAIFQCEAFSVFLFKNSSLYKMVFEALEHYLDEIGQAPGFVVIPTDLKGKYEMGVDDEQIFFISKKGSHYIFSTSEIEDSGSMESDNPFLISLTPKSENTDIPVMVGTTKRPRKKTTKTVEKETTIDS
jgi:hypothetical protein